MNTLLTKDEIRHLCGATHYRRGREYFNAGRVTALEQDGKDPTCWNATVRGTRTYKVTLKFYKGSLEADCTCPAYTGWDWCKHVAAVLFHFLLPVPTQQSLPIAAIVSKPQKSVDKMVKTGYVSQLLEVFQQTAATSVLTASSSKSQVHRECLHVEYFFKPEIFYQQKVLMLEMKVGLKRTYVVKKIRNFLEDVARQRYHFFTQTFSYDPLQYMFSETDQKIIRILHQVMIEQKMFQYSRDGYYATSHLERSLMIPPSAWKKLQPHFQQVTAFIENPGCAPLQFVTCESLPICTNISNGKKGDYTLIIEGLNQMKIFPEYECVIYNNNVFPMDALELNRLLGLQTFVNKFIIDHGMEFTEQVSIPVANEELDTIVNEIVPHLKRVGKVDIDKKIVKRINEYPLQPQVYLDREGETLFANVVFIYGDVTIPLLTQGQSSESEFKQIIIRNLSREQEVKDTLADAGFTQSGEKLQLIGEERIYEFLFNIIAKLQSIAEVFVTPAIDMWTRTRTFKPQSRAELKSNIDWLEVTFDLEDLDEREILQILRSLVEKKKYHRLADGAYLSLESEAFAQIGDLLENLGIDKGHLRANKWKAGKLQLPSIRALPLIDKHQADMPNIKLGKSLRKWLDDLRHPDNLNFEVPARLAKTLREYQIYGFQWMKTLSHYGFGGILADDMGLGKTIQTISYLLSERMEKEDWQPALIVCPASLTFNWKNEITKFAPQLKSAVLTGTKTEREDILSIRDDFDVLITSYPLLLRDIDKISEIFFSVLILDEAQAIKNHTTQTAQAVAAINSHQRFALTGTPVENSLDDLWSIFHAVFPSLLGGRQSFTKLNPEIVAKRIRPFVLRRVKSDVLKELPEKIETLQTTELTPDQKKIYLAYLSKLQDDTRHDLETEGFQKGRIRILSGLTRLRQICCHPALCVENYKGESGKLEHLLELVEEYIAAKQRILIFSQFTSMLAIIRDELRKRKIDHFYLDGQTQSKERFELCNRFNDGDIPIFLISLKAGGTGLNLTGADTVILYDLWWNPAVEEQAANRAHRIGQKRTVQVIRMVTEGTVEEKMYQLQEKKRDLIDQVVHSGSTGANTLTEEDVRELLAL